MSSFEVRLTVTRLVSRLGFRKAIFGKSLDSHSNGSVNGFNGWNGWGFGNL
jgi:hypothetical protein